jgi:serine/threonine protein kinase
VKLSNAREEKLSTSSTSKNTNIISAVKNLRDQVKLEVPISHKKRYDWIFVPEAHLGPPEIFEDEINLTGFLGEDSQNFAKVHTGTCRGEQVAVKVICRDRIKEAEREKFRDLVKIISSANHPNLCLFLGANTTSNQLMIISEFIKSNIEVVINEKGLNLSLSRILQMAKDIALGLNWLHEANPPIIHGNVTPKNLLVDENLRVKISDFGMSKIKKIFGVNTLSDPNKNIESLKWLAPETLDGTVPTKKSDVYSFGLVLWMLISRNKPYSEITTFDKLKENHKKKCRPALPSCSAALQELISNCWSDSTNNRPNMITCISQLETSIINATIPDVKSANFWASHFSNKTSADWDQFINHLATDLNLYHSKNESFTHLFSTGKIQDTNLLRKVKALKLILSTKTFTTSEKAIVQIDKFGWAASWFGSLSTNFLDNVMSLIGQTWFHGEISARMAENLLKGKPTGTFLIRLSVASFGSYTLSYVTSTGSINHYRFSYLIQKNVFEISGSEYTSINQFLEKKGPSFGLTVPCLGSRFVHIDQDENFGYDTTFPSKIL